MRGVLTLALTIPSIIFVVQTFAILSPHLAYITSYLAPLFAGFISILIPLTVIALIMGVIIHLV